MLVRHQGTEHPMKFEVRTTVREQFIDKSSLVGPSLLVPLESGRLMLGTWQGIYLCEFDGPRTRRVDVTVLPGVR
jgi:thiamine phosphate synthase YjbQ (UPF0047 family)